ncbi:hypothetical protein J6590_017643 [Homalodisca vitripennis]|nr:hypothetical protein J6590_017643 [Homalodisca vitripennis]
MTSVNVPGSIYRNYEWSEGSYSVRSSHHHYHIVMRETHTVINPMAVPRRTIISICTIPPSIATVIFHRHSLVDTQSSLSYCKWPAEGKTCCNQQVQVLKETSVSHLEGGLGQV